MADLCWLPSAIMQTTGALIGIYLLVYFYGAKEMDKILTSLQKIIRNVSPEEAPIKVLRKIEKFIDERLLLVIFNRLYILLIISILSGILTIIFSTFWLRSLVNNLGYGCLEALSITLFIITLILILFFSVFTILLIHRLKKRLKEIVAEMAKFSQQHTQT